MAGNERCSKQSVRRTREWGPVTALFAFLLIVSAICFLAYWLHFQLFARRLLRLMGHRNDSLSTTENSIELMVVLRFGWCLVRAADLLQGTQLAA